MATRSQAFFDPSGQWDEAHCREVFDRDYLPYLTREGPRIGESAMLGDKLAEEIIRRTHLFCVWGDPTNLSLLHQDLEQWQRKEST